MLWIIRISQLNEIKKRDHKKLQQKCPKEERKVSKLAEDQQYRLEYSVYLLFLKVVHLLHSCWMPCTYQI